jgi:hypothetical protein
LEPRLAGSAFRREIREQDILHAYRNPIAAWRLDEHLTMRVGGALDGTLLEIGVSTDGANELIVHAIRVRPKYLPAGRNA